MRFFLCFWVVFFFVPQAFALNEAAQGRACEKKIVALIDGAEKYIDAAVYSINRKSIVNALIAAKKRGVKIRLLTDRSQLASIKDMNDVERLMIAGIDVRIHTTKGLMHAKMAVFDGKTQLAVLLTGRIRQLKEIMRSAVCSRTTRLPRRSINKYLTVFGRKIRRINPTGGCVCGDGAGIFCCCGLRSKALCRLW